MPQSVWNESIKALQGLIMKPIIFNDLSVMLLDVLTALHENDWNSETHRHPWFEFNYVSNGAVYTTIEEHEFLITSGHFYIIPPGTFHSHRHFNNQGDDGFCLRWQMELLPTFNKSKQFTPSGKDIINVFLIPRPFGVKEDVGEFIKSVNTDMSTVTQQAVFIQWLILLHERWRENGTKTVSKNDHEVILVQQALLYLSEYYSSNLEVHDLANSLHVSYRHLSRIFKHVTGVTIIEKLNDIRINEAKKLLKETDKTIRQIARAVGYENEYYFSNAFSRFAYISPSGFRSRCKE